MQRAIMRAASALTLLAVLLGSGAARPAAAQSRPAEEVYKNIQALKGVPAEQVPIIMQYFTLALGGNCGTCHVSSANERDDKPEKQAARRMITMVLEINKSHFSPGSAVSCYTCHRGARLPVSTPVPSEVSRAFSQPASSQGVTADALLDNMLAAMGGDAVTRSTSLTAKGTREDAANPPMPVELYASYPDRSALVVHMVGADDLTILDGEAGWTANPSRGVRELIAQEVAGIKLEDPLYLAANARRLYPQWVAGSPVNIGDREAHVLSASAPGRPPVRLYLDAQTGLPLRLIRSLELPVGRLPTEINYSDWREVGGVKVAHKVASIRPQSRNTITLADVQLNISIDPARFARPQNPPPR